MRNRLLLSCLAICILTAPGARAQETDPADLAFWQAIQNSADPAEYKAYLEAFPKGKFATLARIRAAGTGAQVQPTRPDSMADLHPVVPRGKDVGQGEKILLNPAAARVGQQITITCEGFPQPTSYDKLIVVPSGTPDVDPDSGSGSGIKVLWSNYASNCNAYANKAGPFAPGAYEIRFMTRLYNNDGRQEIATRTPFTVR